MLKVWLRLICGNRITVLGVVTLWVGLVWLLGQPYPARGGPLLTRSDFTLAAPQGFGDRHNGWAWSMQWWNEHLYVGTNHSFRCAEVAAINRFFPKLSSYPPEDPDIECPLDPANLDLRAEIWRWTPETDTWEQVYQSPNDVPIPDRPGKLVARDIGYRGMNIFIEPDGTEALYVAGVSSQFLWLFVPPPRILRSIDGRNFEPLPQSPGTVLGDFEGNGFRNQVSHKGRFYIIGGVVQGSGVLLEAKNPAGGNDNFRTISPPEMIVSAAESYNGYLYVGVRDLVNGYSVVKTDATGVPPYNYTTVIEQGGYKPSGEANSEILHMKVFKNRLYAGGNGIKAGITGLAGPAELIRINPDDTWDVVVGNPRLTPDGWKYPISGFDAGFGNFFNGHMWRLGVFEDSLYVGTFDSSTVYKDSPLVEPLLRHLMGFDLYGTPDGTHFFPISTRGFGDKFNFGVRSLEATPYGFFLGTANYYYGLQIWRSQGKPQYRVYLPSIVKFASKPSSAASSSKLSAVPNPLVLWELQPPSGVEAEVIDDNAVLVSWEPVMGAVRYRIVRFGVQTVNLPLSTRTQSLVDDLTLLELTEETEEILQAAQQTETTIWTPAEEIGMTNEIYFIDRTTEFDHRYVYFVEAIDNTGWHSTESNLAPAPSAAPLVTFTYLVANLADLRNRGYLTREGGAEIVAAVGQAQTLVEDADYAGAVRTLDDLQIKLGQEDQTPMPSWKAEDILYLLVKLKRRIRLTQVGIIPVMDLN